MIFLSTSESLARLGGAFPPGHRLLGLAAELAAGEGTDTGLAGRVFSRKGNSACCAAELGVLGASVGSGSSPSAAPYTLMLWFNPGRERASRVAAGQVGPASEGGNGCRQLVLDLPSGRYRIEYWDVAECRLAGVETATAAPLVLGLPDPRAAYAILIAPLS